MRRTFAIRSLLLVAVAPIAAGCLGDQGSALAYRGHAYLGVDGSAFTIDPARLTDVGRPDRVNSPGTDGRVYMLPGVPWRAAVVTKGPGTDMTVYVVDADGEAGLSPLGNTVPDLCPYLVNPVRAGCPSQ